MKRLVPVVVLLAAGCGSGAAQPQLPRSLAASLRAQVDEIAAGRGCGPAGELRASVIRAVNAHHVPPALQEPLTSKVNELAAQCTPRRARDLAAWLSRYSP